MSVQKQSVSFTDTAIAFAKEGDIILDCFTGSGMTGIAAQKSKRNAIGKKIDLAKSKVSWVGKKVTGQHEGTIKLSEGSLIFKKDALVRFVEFL